MKPIQLIINGEVLHERFSALVLDALGKLEPAPALPPLPKGHIYFQALDNSLHSIPRKYLAKARHIDPGLMVVRERHILNTQGTGFFTATNTQGRSPSKAKLTSGEHEVLRTLRFVVFAS